MSTAYTHIFPGPWYKQLHNQVETLSSSLLNTVKTRCRYNMILFMCKTSQFTIYRYVHKKKSQTPLQHQMPKQEIMSYGKLNLSKVCHVETK